MTYRRLILYPIGFGPTYYPRCRFPSVLRNHLSFFVFVILIVASNGFSTYNSCCQGLFLNHIRRKGLSSTSTSSSSSFSPPEDISSQNFRITRIPIESEYDSNNDDDWNALADLRYDEWIVPTEQQENTATTTSRHAFRMATRDIYIEERPRSCLLLAKTVSDRESEVGIVIGAAEMSPYEVEPALKNFQSSTTTNSAWYVTDVVTVATYRRKGIARNLMKVLEEEASAQHIPYLVLHVVESNLAAVQFYQSLGYSAIQRSPTSEEYSGNYEKDEQSVFLEFLDFSKLEEEAGTQGQLLMVKKLQ